VRRQFNGWYSGHAGHARVKCKVANNIHEIFDRFTYFTTFAKTSDGTDGQWWSGRDSGIKLLLSMPAHSAKQQRKQKRKLEAETTRESNVAAVTVLIPQNFSDEEKWMYLAFRNEMRVLIDWERKYDYYWMDHVLQMMTGCDPETLTMKIEGEEEDRKDSVIECLIERLKYNEAFHVATGSSFFYF
jgi:hypothetical protein